MSTFNHAPALYVLLPIIGALLSAVSFNIKFSRIVAIVLISCAVALSINQADPASYTFGNWRANLGIEYKIDNINKYIILYINAVLIFLLLFCNKLITEHIIDHIKDRYKHLFYAILLFAHAGFTGILATDDLFNLYVFIEISSLASYVLISLGNNGRAVVAAFDYLIIGSIGASLILIGIGLILSITGSLNISDIRQIIDNAALYDNIILLTACIFLITGTILKIAFFPMHFWMQRAYNNAPAIILIYLGGIGSIIGLYMFYKFTHNLLDYTQIAELIKKFLKPLAVLGILIPSIFAYGAKNLRSIVVYSSCASVAYGVFFITQIDKTNILMPFLFIDSINKISLFLLTAYYESNKYRIKNIFHYKYLIALILIFSVGLPLSGMFLVKITMLEFLYINKLYLEFIIFVAVFVFALAYYYKIALILIPFQGNHEPSEKKIIPYDLAVLIGVQLIILLHFDTFSLVNKESKMEGILQINEKPGPVIASDLLEARQSSSRHCERPLGSAAIQIKRKSGLPRRFQAEPPRNDDNNFVLSNTAKPINLKYKN